MSTIPRPGLGTWQNDDPATCARSVRTALEMGFRHIDTAQIYRNETAVGRGIRDASVDREEVFLATKVWTDRLAPGDVGPSVEASLERLGTGYVDLLYVHWPARTYDPVGTLGAMAELVEEGVVRRVGVSNFTPQLLEEAVEVCPVPIVANQVEMHPYLTQREQVEVTRELGMDLVAYSPLARTRVLDDPVVVEVAEARGVTPAQVVLAWLMEEPHVVPIPKATGEDHIRENLQAAEVDLGEDDVARLDGIERKQRVVDPGFAPSW